jgi:hypothetical protein
MMGLILILGQIVVLVATLGIVFFIIDKAIDTARRKGFLLIRKKHRRLGKVNRKATGGLWNKLLTQLQFDTAAAERLTNSLKRRYPGKSDNWYIEKAIQDLERDRS